jgi:peptidoglycan hydrolase CwlO-like protein
MSGHNSKNFIIAFVFTGVLVGVILPVHVVGKVKQITETEQKLEGITEEEKTVLKELFTINQKLSELQTEEEKINNDISLLEQQIAVKQKEIDTKQEDYDNHLDILKQVLVNYQRGGPATYLEILLRAEDLSSFLKSLNVMKDISHNVKELLTSLGDAKKVLVEEKQKLDEKAVELDERKAELAKNLADNQLIQKEKENYLASLLENKDYYTQQLSNLELMWSNCKSIFPKLTDEITKFINEGYFTLDDLNMKFGLLQMEGYLKENTFNSILEDKDELNGVTFDFKEEKVFLNLTEEHLILTGNFVIEGDNAILYEVKEGTFYDMPLEQSSLEELFQEKPLLIDFKSISEGIITIAFTLDKIESKEDQLNFEISPKW